MKMEHLNYNHELRKIKSIETLQELFSEFISLARDTLTDFNNQSNPDFYKIVYQNLLQRLYLGISATDILFDEFRKNKYFKYPIAIQMRTCILDSITIAYLALFIDKQDGTKFREQVCKLNHPVAREINDEIIEMIKNGDSKYDEHFKLALSYFPDSFTNEGGIKLKKIKELKPSDMVKSLKGTPFEYYIDIYKLYKHYSKYEHYSSISKNLIEFDAEYEFDNFTLSTYFIFQAAYMTMQFMEIDKDKIEKMKFIRDRIIEVEPTFKAPIPIRIENIREK
jgi:hypothetical protein